MSKIAIIVPYRNRKKQLDRFLNYFTNSNLDCHIFVVEQDDERPFNQGKLLNVGFLEAVKDFDYFAFHDVDLIPDSDVDYTCDVDKPIHLAGYTSEYDYELQFADYFGGVTLFTKEQYELVNGRSNNYWGWGFEDDDLLYRCKQVGLPLDKKFFGVDETLLTSGLVFDGYDDYVKIKVSEELSKLTQNDFTISVRINPQEQHQVSTIPYDEHFVLSIPGYHCGLSYTSHRRYKADIFDSNKKSNAIMTDIETHYPTLLSLVYSKDENRMSFYQNDKLIDSTYVENILDYTKQSYIYLGCANPKENDYSYFFRGTISEVAIWNSSVEQKFIEKVCRNKAIKSLTKFDYNESLLLYYDFKHIINNQVLDNSGWYNNGEIIGAYHTEEIGKLGRYVDIPFRRKGTFTSQSHKKSAWAAEGLRWIHDETRDNQTRFFNKVKKGLESYTVDGLNTLKCKIKDIKQNSLYTHIKVEL